MAGVVTETGLPSLGEYGVVAGEWNSSTQRDSIEVASQQKIMVTTEESTIVVKTKELCQTILDQPEFAEIRRHVDAFMADEDAKGQYQSVMEKGDILHQKQHTGAPLSGEEIAEFESAREKLLANPLAKGFLEAQESMHRVQSSVSQYVAKTFELGRLPSEEDFNQGSCGEGCGCH